MARSKEFEENVVLVICGDDGLPSGCLMVNSAVEFATRDAEEQAEHLHAVYVGIRVMTRTSISPEKLQRIADVSFKLLLKN
ncbi:hypothetical protein D3C73_1200640 [compost metagenome]